MVGGNALAHDLAGHRHELEVEILDAQRVDLLAHRLDLLVASRLFDEAFDIHVYASLLAVCSVFF